MAHEDVQNMLNYSSVIVKANTCKACGISWEQLIELIAGSSSVITNMSGHQ